MDELLDAVNAVAPTLRRPGAVAPVTMLFAYSRDHAVGLPRNSNLLELLLVRLQCKALTFLSGLKSRLGKGVYNRRGVAVRQVQFHGSVHMNLNNGTVTLIETDVVWKFYFKDIVFFFDLHQLLARFTQAACLRKDRCLIVRRPRFSPLTGSRSLSELLVALRPALDSYHNLLPGGCGIDDRLTPAAKVSQLATFYGVDSTRDVAPYLEVADRLTDRSTSCRLVLCHGDLWTGNILMGPQEELRLIDFDKSLRFCLPYDYVYFYLMGELATRRTSAKEMIDNLDTYAESASRFLHEDCGGTLGTFSELELRLSAYLFGLLKLAERDFRHLTPGRSIDSLVAALDQL